jgi:hypothetical protein
VGQFLARLGRVGEIRRRASKQMNKKRTWPSDTSQVEVDVVDVG